MSHISTVRSTIQNVNETILRDTVQWVAKELGLVATKDARDWNGQVIPGVLGIRFKGEQRGVVARITPQGLELIGDPYGHDATYKQLTTGIQNGYKAKARAAALARMGFKVQARVTSTGAVLMEAVKA